MLISPLSVTLQMSGMRYTLHFFPSITSIAQCFLSELFFLILSSLNLFSGVNACQQMMDSTSVEGMSYSTI